MEKDRHDNQSFPHVPLVTAWTPERRELHQWFRDHAPSLVDAYEGVVRLLGVPAFPGRIHLISHVVRDICNRLPDFLGSIERDRIHYDRELDALAEIWPDLTGPTAADYTADPSGLSEESDVGIPRVAAVAVSQLLDKHRGRQTNRDVAGDLFARVAEADEHDRANLEPIAAEFHNTAKWFMQRAHLRTKPMTEPGHEELLRRFEQFERLALSLIRGFFKTMDELNVLLQQANARTD